MQIPWKIKSFLFGAIDATRAMPLLYFAQRHITKRSRVNISGPKDRWQFHERNLKTLDKPRVLEFGAGKNLAQNLYLSAVCGSQMVVDLFPMFDPALANSAAQAISKFTKVAYKPIASADDLAQYNITYKAPLDVARSGFPNNSFDACVSTDTLEHIPAKDIPPILKELKRILRPGGVISAMIDYSDHYAHTDGTISKVEFLRYANDEYSFHNHRSHYQNRLRHGDFEKLFREAGFIIKQAEAKDFVEPPAKIASQFDKQSNTLTATSGWFLLENQKA